MRKIDIGVILILILIVTVIAIFLIMEAGPVIIPFALGLVILFAIFILASILSGHYRTTEI